MVAEVEQMPLDLQWALSALNGKNLEQAGIIANFFAGIILAIEYFVVKDKIDQINDLLEQRISNSYSNGLRLVKEYAKWNRKIVLAIIIAIILIAIFQAMFYQDASVRDYFLHYYSQMKIILVPMRRILLVFLAVLAILFVILFISHSMPKRTLGALGVLLYIIGNILLFLHTLL